MGTKPAVFVDGSQSTLVMAAYLNDLRTLCYELAGDGTNAPATAAAVRTNLALAKSGVNTDITSLDAPVLATRPDLLDASEKIPDTTWVANYVQGNYNSMANTVRGVGFKVEVAANACTVTLTKLTNTDSTDELPAYLGYTRNYTDTAGIAHPVVPTLSSPYSITIPDGATLGTLSGVPARIWVVLLGKSIAPANDFAIGVVNCTSSGQVLSILGTTGTANLTEKCDVVTIGTGSDSAGVVYSNVTKAGIPFVVLGCFDIQEATAGVWATAPTAVHLNPQFRPGQLLESYRNYSGAVATGTTQFVDDDNIPAVTAGTSLALFNGNLPNNVSANGPNRKRVSVLLNVAVTVGADSIMASLVDLTDNVTLACARIYDPTASQIHQISLAAECLASHSVEIRFGPIGAHTVTVNGMAGARKHGGALQSYARVDLISA